jgi:hypothetical protein
VFVPQILMCVHILRSFLCIPLNIILPFILSRFHLRQLQAVCFSILFCEVDLFWIQPGFGLI